MPVTIREYLGDEKIAQLEGMGFLPNLIADMAKRQYMQDRQAKRNELTDSGLDGKLVQGIIRGNINEEEARNAQKFEDFGAKKHGWGLGAAKTVAGIANAAERVSDFVNPFYEGQRDEKGNYVYQNAIEKGLRPKIKSAEKLRDDYEKATGETSWGSRTAEIGTEMVADPLNFVGGLGLLSKGSKLAQFGKKTLYFAGTGAASGGVMALGEGRNDEETLKNMGYGAVGGFVLGHTIDQSIQGISKLIAKRRASRASNEADAIDHAQNSDFLSGSNGGGSTAGREAAEAVNTAPLARGGVLQRGAGDEIPARKDGLSSSAEMMTAREFATGEAGLDEATAAKVVKEATKGKEKSDFVDADTYADIVNFKNFENQRDYAKAYGEQIEAAKQSLNNAREQSAVRYADTQKAINEYQKQGMSASATRELINAKFKPGADEINYTRAYNGGVDVDPRLAGQGIFYALEKDIAVQAYAPEIYATRLKQRGFGDESAQVFTQAYVQKDINIAKDWANAKVAEAYEGQIQKQIAEEIRARDEAETNGLSDSVSSIGDNASRASGRQGSDEQILRQGRWDTSNAGETKQRAQSDRQMEQRLAAKTDGETDAAATGEQVVEKQKGDAGIGGGVSANSNAHLGSGLVAGTLNSVDEDGNFSPERFAAGFLAGLAGGKAIATGLRKMTPKLYNQILGAAEKMPQMANGNPRLLGKLYSNGKDVSLNSFAGEKAITANVGKLDQAKALLEKGADEVEIWQKTGWFKDKDEAWKFEIGDSNAKLNPNFQSGGKLGDLLEHKELFKAYPELKDVTVVKIDGEIPEGVAQSVKDVGQKEKRGIYNVTYNDKKATLVKHDVDSVENALKYAKGNKDKGAKHINIRHMKDDNAEGYVTQNELLNIGKNMREYLAKYERPFINKRNARIYEWQDESGVRFRLVVSNKSGEGRGLPSGENRNLSPITNDLRPAANEGLSPNSSLDEIITFYSDRNLKGRMEFENPKVKYDVNLNEWHKDSAPITKNVDGSPKVFYHGSPAKDITEFKSEFDNSGYGFWFNQSNRAATEFKQGGKIYQVYLNVKNPIDLSFPYSQKAKNLFDEAEKLGIDTELYPESQSDAFKKFLEQKGYDGIVMDDLDGAAKYPHVIVFNSNQIKHIKNNGSFSDNPNIYKSWAEGHYDPARNEIGLSSFNDKSTLMHEIQHAIQEIEDFGRGGSVNKARVELEGHKIRELKRELEEVEKLHNSTVDNAFSLDDDYFKLSAKDKESEYGKKILATFQKQKKFLKELSAKRDKLKKELANEYDKSQVSFFDTTDRYRKYHGEAEARNVQNRLNLEDGAKIHPHKTFDVNPNETIVSKDGGVNFSHKIEEIKREHPNVERELDESIAAMRKESFNDLNFKTQLLNKFGSKKITTQELGKSVNLNDKQLAVLKNNIKNADFKVISDSKIYFDKMGKDGDKKRFFVDIAEDGSLRVDAYAKSKIDSIPIKQSALEELADAGDSARLKNMSFEVKAAYRNELDPIKKEAILKTAELNKLKKAAQGGDKAAVAKFEEFKAKNLDEDGNIKDGLELC